MKEFSPHRLVFQQAEGIPDVCGVSERECPDRHQDYLNSLDSKLSLLESVLEENPNNEQAKQLKEEVEQERQQYRLMLHAFEVIFGHLDGDKNINVILSSASLTFAVFETSSAEYPFQAERFAELKGEVLDRLRALEPQITDPTLRNQAREMLGLAPLTGETIYDNPEITPEKIMTATKNLGAAYSYIRNTLLPTLRQKAAATGSGDLRNGLAQVEALVAEPLDVNDYIPLMIKESMLDKNNVSPSGARGLFQILPSARAEIKMYYGFNVSDAEAVAPVSNCVIGMLYLHRCRNKYGRAPQYNGLSEADHEMLARTMYNAGPTLINKIWSQLNPASYADFEDKLSKALAKQIDPNFRASQVASSERVKDPTYYVTYDQPVGVKYYLNDQAKRAEKLVVNGQTLDITVGKTYEVLRYARIIDAIEDLARGQQRPTTVPPSQEGEPEAPTKKYVVKSGDTLWSISRDHGMTVDHLCSLNGFTQTHVIHPGDVLKVKAAASEEIVLPENTQEMVWKAITLESGETLWSTSEQLRKQVKIWGVAGFEATESPIDYVTRDEERILLMNIIIDFNNTYNGTNIPNVYSIPAHVRLLIPNAIYIKHWMAQSRSEDDINDILREGERKKRAENPPPAPSGLGETPPGIGRRAYVSAGLEKAGTEILTNKYRLDLNTVKKNPHGLKNTPDRPATSHIILHSTNVGRGSADRGYDETLAKHRAHYVVSREGEIIQVRDPNDNMDHAGRITNRSASKALWDGDGFINDKSIGIEVATYAGEAWSPAQYEAVKKLVHALGAKYSIPANHVLTHSQVACGKGFRIAKPDPLNVNWASLDLPNNYMLIDYDVLYGDLEANFRDVSDSRRPVSFEGINENSPMLAGLRETNRLRSDPAFVAELRRIEEAALAEWKHDIERRATRMADYTVRAGDSLGKIAKNNQTTVAIIKKYNGLTSDKLRVGQKLKVPVNVR